MVKTQPVRFSGLLMIKRMDDAHQKCQGYQVQIADPRDTGIYKDELVLVTHSKAKGFEEAYSTRMDEVGTLTDLVEKSPRRANEALPQGANGLYAKIVDKLAQGGTVSAEDASALKDEGKRTAGGLRFLQDMSEAAEQYWRWMIGEFPAPERADESSKALSD